MEALSADSIRGLVHTIRELMDAQRDYLIDIDATMGDGDLGLTMSRAFAAADDQLAELEEQDPGKLLSKVGTAIAKAAPSTMGTLVATGFMRGGKAVSGIQEIGPAELASFLEAFTEGLMQRGKAAPGDKTIIDVLKPAADACRTAANNGSSLREAVRQTYEAAERGNEKAKELQAQHGRPAYYQDQSVGKPDPGAAAGLLLVQGFRDYLQSVS